MSFRARGIVYAECGQIGARSLGTDGCSAGLPASTTAAGLETEPNLAEYTYSRLPPNRILLSARS